MLSRHCDEREDCGVEKAARAGEADWDAGTKGLAATADCACAAAAAAAALAAVAACA